MAGIAFLSVRGTVAVDGVLGPLHWAARPTAASSSGMMMFVDDVGVGGSLWVSDGVRWRPDGGELCIKNLVTPISNSGAALTVMDSATIPAGLVQDGDILSCEVFKSRTGGAADTDITALYLGTAAAVIGTATGLTNASLAAANISMALHWDILKQSPTSLIPVAIAGGLGYGVSTVAAASVAVSNMDTQTTYLQISSDLTAAAGEVVVLRKFRVKLLVGS